MKISPEEIIHVANLANLQLTAEEVKSMTAQFTSILAYMAKLNELKTDGIEPSSHAISIRNAFRADEVRESLDQKTALANGPQHNGTAFIVPKVI